MTPATKLMSNIHIADIDFPALYEQVFSSLEAARDFYSRLDTLPQEKNAAKTVFHQAGRMVWLADQIDVVAHGRPAFQILFYLITAELVAKITLDFKGEGQSRKYVHRFFGEICSDQTRLRLGNSFSRTSIGNLNWEKVADLLYEIRCDVVHEGMYYTFHLQLNERDFPLLTQVGGISFTTDLTIREIRQMVLEGAVLASERLLKAPHNSAPVLTSQHQGPK